MIAGNIKDKIQRKYLSQLPRLKEAFDFLESTNWEDLAMGRVEINEDNIFAFHSKYSTKLYDGAIWEAHRKYLDIQFMIEGYEKIGICDIEKMFVNREYSEEADAVLGIAEAEKEVFLREGDFVILFPKEAHVPGITIKDSEPVHKIVVKIPLE